MARRFIICLSLLAATTSCGGSGSSSGKKPAAAKKAPPPVAAPVEEAPEMPTGLEYVYSPVGKRDPFRSILLDLVAADQKPDENAPPDCGPLCKWELEQFKLVAVISGVSNPMAMVEDPQRRGHLVRRGAFMGKRNGKVTQIRSGEIVVTEIFKDQMGKPHIIPVVIRLPAEKTVKGMEDQNLLGPEVSE